MRKLYLDELDRMINSVKKSGSTDRVPRALTSVFNDQRNALNQEMMKLNPRDLAGKVNAPILLLSGALEQQIEPEENASELMEALRRRSNSVQESKVVPGLGYFLKPVSDNKEGEPEEKADDPLSQEMSDTISSWLKSHI